MDVKHVNPFIEAFFSVMPQVGFSDMQKHGITVNDDVKSKGIIINLGIVGDIKGNIVYIMDIESGKKIASKMMMGMPVDELDEMAQSALSELTNMLTANASINLSNMGLNINISTPTLLYGQDIQIRMNVDKVLVIQLTADDIPIDINLAFQNS